MLLRRFLTAGQHEVLPEGDDGSGQDVRGARERRGEGAERREDAGAPAGPRGEEQVACCVCFRCVHGAICHGRFVLVLESAQRRRETRRRIDGCCFRRRRSRRCTGWQCQRAGLPARQRRPTGRRRAGGNGQREEEGEGAGRQLLRRAWGAKEAGRRAARRGRKREQLNDVGCAYGLSRRGADDTTSSHIQSFSIRACVLTKKSNTPASLLSRLQFTFVHHLRAKQPLKTDSLARTMTTADTVLRYLRDMNRPFNAVNVADALASQGVKKSQVSWPLARRKSSLLATALAMLDRTCRRPFAAGPECAGLASECRQSLLRGAPESLPMTSLSRASYSTEVPREEARDWFFLLRANRLRKTGNRRFTSLYKTTSSRQQRRVNIGCSSSHENASGGTSTFCLSSSGSPSQEKAAEDEDMRNLQTQIEDDTKRANAAQQGAQFLIAPSVIITTSRVANADSGRRRRAPYRYTPLPAASRAQVAAVRPLPRGGEGTTSQARAGGEPPSLAPAGRLAPPIAIAPHPPPPDPRPRRRSSWTPRRGWRSSSPGPCS